MHKHWHVQYEIEKVGSSLWVFSLLRTESDQDIKGSNLTDRLPHKVYQLSKSRPLFFKFKHKQPKFSNNNRKKVKMSIGLKKKYELYTSTILVFIHQIKSKIKFNKPCK